MPLHGYIPLSKNKLWNRVKNMRKTYKSTLEENDATNYDKTYVDYEDNSSSEESEE